MLSGTMSDDEMLPPVGSTAQRKSIKNSSHPNTNEIIKAYQVTAHKYIDSKYENRGKIGLALLGSKTACTFSILLYGKGNSALAQVQINKDLELTSARELYISFYDVKSDNWSILFENVDVYNDFFNRTSILKLVSTKQDLVCMDVKIGEGILVHDSDLCEAEIVISGIKNCEIVSTIYSSENQETNKIIRLKVGANKLLPAVDKGISGMMRGGQRNIMVSSQSALLKGGSVKVPNDNAVLINVKIIRIKTKTEKPAMSNECGDSELSLPNLNFNKDTDYEAGDQSKKIELINRMKRMGQPIVKFNVSEESDSSVSKSPEVSNYVQTNPTYMSKPQQVSNISLYDSSPFNNQMMPLHAANPIMTAMQQMYQPLPAAVQTVSTDNLVFTETRQHNTEMRIAISKLQDKVDRISDKLDNSAIVQKQPVGRHMDAENVFENIKRIIDENEVLKRECSQKSDTIDSQNKRINELLNKSQKYLEESRNVIERSSATFNSNDSENQRKILQLEEEKLDLIRNLSKKTSELSNLEMRAEASNCESQVFRNKSVELTDQLNKLSIEIGDFKLKNRSLLTEIDNLKEERMTIMGKNEEFIDSKRLALDNERKCQSTIDSLKNALKESNGNLERVRTECENEIMEIRKQCNNDIEQMREKMKQERRMVNSKSSSLETELDSINREWEAKLTELKQSEATKLSKIIERNSQLTTENSSLSREIFDLKDQLILAESNTAAKIEELSRNNKQLQRQLEEARIKADEVNRLQDDKSESEREIARLTKFVAEMGDVREELQTALDRKLQLESMVKTLTEELSVKPVTETKVQSQNNDLEAQIKIIMNDIFKKIKSEFTFDKNYSGKEINGKCMIIIRDSTVKLMKSTNNDGESSDSDTSDEEINDRDDNITELLTEQSNLLHDSFVRPENKSLEDVREDFDTKEDEKIQESGDNHGNVDKEEQFSEIRDTENMLEYEKNDKIVNDDNYVEIPATYNLISDNDDFMQYNNANTNVEINNETDLKEDVTIETSVTETDDIPQVDDAINLSPSLCNDLIPVQSSQSTENVSNDLETKWETESKLSSSKTDIRDNVVTVESKDKGGLFSSDEDEDVSGFFEQLNQKKKAKVEQSKPISSELDDELSWLHS